MKTTFRMGSLDHVHLRVPDRAEAARWYADNLGFEPVADFEFWAEGFEGGPLQISADGGKTTLALFEATPSHPMAPQITGVAFSVEPDVFAAFVRALPGAFVAKEGEPLTPSHVVDFDLCWAIEFVDPWGNRFELNTYAYDAIKRDLIDRDGIEPSRYWPADLFVQYTTGASARVK